MFSDLLWLTAKSRFRYFDVFDVRETSVDGETGTREYIKSPSIVFLFSFA